MPPSEPLLSEQAAFAKHLFLQGYPLWNPDPASLPRARQSVGLKIGDVGTVDERGRFDFFFNILESPPGGTGSTANFPPIEEDDVRCDGDDLLPREVASSPKTLWEVDQLDMLDVAGVTRKTTQYGATLSDDGAHIILPQGAQSFELGLHHKRLFENHAREHGADWLDRFRDRLGWPRSNSIYLLTGFYKTCSWSIASFSMQSAANTDPVRVHCTLVEVDERIIREASVWQPAGRFERKIGPPPDRQGRNNQTIFIRGITVTPNVSEQGPSERRSTGLLGMLSPSTWFLNSLGRDSTKAIEAESSGSNIIIQHVPQISQASHPSEIINQYLLTKEPSARIAVTHDSHWISMLKSFEAGQLGTLEDLVNRLEELLPMHYSIVTDNNTVYLSDKEDGSPTHSGVDRLHLPSDLARDTTSDLKVHAHDPFVNLQRITDSGDSSSDDDRPKRFHHLQSSHSSSQHPSSLMFPSSSYPTINKPVHPTLTTDMSQHIASSNSSPTLSSPSSQSSNAVEPTPSSGQAASPDIAAIPFTREDDSAVDERSHLPHPSRTQKMADESWKPWRGSSYRSRVSESSPHSPTPSGPLPSQERVIMVTCDFHAFTMVDVTPANSAAFVWEQIFTELRIPDEDRSLGFSIYHTQVNHAAVGEALTNDSLLRLIREQGDSEGNLRFLVCRPYAQVPGAPLPASPVRSISPLPSVFRPLVPRSKASQPSTEKSIPSGDPIGDDLSAVSDDLGDADKSTLRRRQYLPNLLDTFSSPSTQNLQHDTRQPPPLSARMTYSSPTDEQRQPDLSAGAAVQHSHSTPALEDSKRGMESVNAESSYTLLSSFVSRGKTPRSAGVGASASDETIVQEREPIITQKTSSRPSPRRKGIPRADASTPARQIQTSRQMGEKIAPTGSYITWKAADLVPGSSPSRYLRGTEIFQNVPPPPPFRSTPSHLWPELSNPTTTSIRPPELPSPSSLAPHLHRPLPPTPGPSTDDVDIESRTPTRSFPRPRSSPPTSASPTSYLSLSQEPYPRPHSASLAQQRFPSSSDLSGHDASRDRDVLREDEFSGNTLPLLSRAGPYTSSSVRPSLTPEVPPRSHGSAATSRLDSLQNSPSRGQDTLSEPTTATTRDSWSSRPVGQMVHEDKLGSHTSPRSSRRPALEVVTYNTNNDPRDVLSNFATPDYVPQPQPQPRLRDPQSRTPRDRYKSTLEEYTWARRPPPEDLYDRFEEFFPEHDLDKPIIEASSGGILSTAIGSSHGITSDDQERTNNAERKRSIRVIAKEHRKRLDRAFRAESSYGNLPHKSTKLWGGHIEEITTLQKKPTVSKPTVDAPSGDPRPIFRWIRGELIGKGTYGRVYLALNATTGEMIAVKQVEIPTTASDKSDGRQASFVRALKTESEKLKDLDHSHIVAYLGFQETPNLFSVFLEYIPGGSIGSCLRDSGKFDEEVTRSFTAQILDGLAYLHSKNIIHGDLKADSVLVEKTGVCKISDFGIWKRANTDQATYTAMRRAVFWMAPEAISNQKGRGYSSKVDIWSVGCVVLEMWTGRRPWLGEDFFTVMLNVSYEGKQPPIPPDVILSDLAVDFKDRCFAVHPGARADATELARHPYLKLPEGWVFNNLITSSKR